MINKSLFIFATINPKEKYFKRAKKALLNILEPTQKEEGCLNFELYDDGSFLYLHEEWRDESCLRIHHDKSYTKELFEKYNKWLFNPVEVIKMKKSIKKDK